MTTKQWLMKIAEAVEKWPTLPKDSVEVAMAVTTPAGAMAYIAKTIMDVGEQAAVLAALPKISTEDFTEAARRIRDVAAALPQASA